MRAREEEKYEEKKGKKRERSHLPIKYLLSTKRKREKEGKEKKGRGSVADNSIF